MILLMIHEKTNLSLPRYVCLCVAALLLHMLRCISLVSIIFLPVCVFIYGIYAISLVVFLYQRIHFKFKIFICAESAATKPPPIVKKEVVKIILMKKHESFNLTYLYLNDLQKYGSS